MVNTISLDQIPRYHPQVATRTYDSQAVIILADSGEATLLNQSGTFLWVRIDGRKRVMELSEALAANYGLSAAEAEEDTLDFLNSLLDAKAIELNR